MKAATRSVGALLTLVGFLALGCGPETPDASRTLPPPVFGSASIVGSVKLVGPPPPVRMLDIGSCHTGAVAAIDETVVVGSSGELANAIVYLIDAPLSTGVAQPQLVLDQVGCKYVPRITAVQSNQPLKITTSDSVFHNVHWVSQHNGNVNVGLPKAGDFKTVAFTTPEFIRVRCDVHPWMNAWVGVFDHPFFAVTNEKGQFKIDKVPAGTYRVGVWHELYGTRELSLVVTDSAPGVVRFEFAPPAK